jgi:hypothetical protein
MLKNACMLVSSLRWVFGTVFLVFLFEKAKQGPSPMQIVAVFSHSLLPTVLPKGVFAAKKANGVVGGRSYRLTKSELRPSVWSQLISYLFYIFVDRQIYKDGPL